MIEFKKYIHHGQDLEEAILGICLLEKTAFGRTYGIVDEENFYFNCHRIVYSAMKEMYDQSLPIDILTVSEFLISKKGVAEILDYNITYFLTRLTNNVVSSAHLEYHCHLIKEMWRRRKIIELKYKKIDGINVNEEVNNMNDELNKILGSKYKQEWYDMAELMYDLLIHQYDMAKGKKTFITTGFKKLDQTNGGFYGGQMIVIGARPSVGKSALMGQMAIKMAKTGKKIGLISLEMNNKEIAARLASLETDIDFSKVFRTIANDQELHEKFYNYISKNTINLPIFSSDKTKVNIRDIRAKATKLKSSKGCDCLIIDYLQLVDSSNENKQYNREQEVSKISRGIKLLAHELDIPIVVLCQLNRASTTRSKADRYPKLSDLRESGAIEQDADIVMFIHRDWVTGNEVDEDGRSTEFLADLLVPKWRNGATSHLILDFDPPKMRFTERIEFNVKEISLPYKDKDDPF